MTVHPALEKALAQFDDEEIPMEIPGELPLMERFRRAFPSEGALSNLDVLFIQHHLGPLVPRLETMVRDGLERSRCWFVDIPYSTNSRVREELITKGYPAHQMTTLFTDPLENYSESQASRVSFLMHRLAHRSNPRPLLVIDDGAYFVRFLKSVLSHAPDLADHFCQTAAVEQTTRGHRFLGQVENSVLGRCGLRVVSIARCHTKTNFEGPFIGAAVARSLVRALGAERIEGLGTVGVIGFGPVGRATSRQLTRRAPKATVHVVDIDASLKTEAERMGEHCRFMQQLAPKSAYDLVMGCTGYASFRIEDRHLLADGAVLASGSSAAVEFNRTGFVELADRVPDDEIEILEREATIRKGIHATLKFQREGGKRFSFLNAGFPVNFDGRLECLPARIIQATHCLLFAAARQALGEKTPGLKKIDDAKDRWILANAIEELETP